MHFLRVLDFDGTLTLVFEEAAPFIVGYLADTAYLCGVKIEVAQDVAATMRLAIRSDPVKYGWEVGDPPQIVAPAMVDPYLQTMPIARAIFERFDPAVVPGFQERLLELLDRHNSKTEDPRTGWLKDLAYLLDMPGSEIEEILDSHGHALENGAMECARWLFNNQGLFRNVRQMVQGLLQVLYRHNYTNPDPETGERVIAFQPGARACLETVTSINSTVTVVITNSHTDAVSYKIHLLGGGTDDTDPDPWAVELKEHVYGDARKYMVLPVLPEDPDEIEALGLDSDFLSLPQGLAVPGLDRPVLLWRYLYYAALNRLRREYDFEWSQVVVVGDIFELDLALPLALGATVGLLINEFTPQHEIDFLDAHPRGRIIQTVEEIETVVPLAA